MKTMDQLEDCDKQQSRKVLNEKMVPNPVLYQLVRVEGDGTLVPATDDDVMEVEELLEDGKTKLPLGVRTEQLNECVLNNEKSSNKANLENLEGVLLPWDTVSEAEQLNDRSEVMLQNDEQEKKVYLATAALAESSKLVKADDPLPCEGDDSLAYEKLPIKEQLEETNPSLLPRLADPYVPPVNEPTLSGPSTPASSSSSQPDFFRLKGEICLDNFSTRELHDTFRATFGRETKMKDKMWLKRRIAMGLTNSCDVVTTSFIIRGNTLVRRGVQEEKHKLTESSESAGLVEGDTNSISQIGDENLESGKRVRSPRTEYECEDAYLENEQSEAKRLRKPTKRFIEELPMSDTKECGDNLLPSVKVARHVQSPPKPITKPVSNVGSCGLALVTRQESFGGAGIQVPYVCRMRRGRPRENFMTLMKYHPCGMSAAVNLVQKDLGAQVSGQDSESENKNVKAGDILTDQQQPTRNDMETKKPTTITCMKEQTILPLNRELQEAPEGTKSDSEDTLDNEVPEPLTAKGGMRRKHHRSWDIGEVVKLVEGVSKYGIGRWSEIKKVSFASSPYRTSVDLKDKWRNLLRASFAQPQEQTGKNSRKNVAPPIPLHILSRVRELTEKHSRGNVTPKVPTVKFPCFTSRNVHEKKSAGFL